MHLHRDSNGNSVHNLSELPCKPELKRYLYFLKHSFWAYLECFDVFLTNFIYKAFALAALTCMISLPTFLASSQQYVPNIIATPAYSIAIIAPSFILIITTIAFIALVFMKKVPSLSLTTIRYTIISGIAQGIGLILVVYTSDQIGNRSRFQDQAMLSAVWILFAWPTAEYLYPEIVGIGSNDRFILWIVQISGLLSLLVSYLDIILYGNPARIFYTFIFMIGIIFMWISRVLIWETSARFVTLREHICVTGISSIFQVFSVLSLIWVDILPYQFGYHESIKDTIRDNIMATLNIFSHSFIAGLSLISFCIAYFLLNIKPSKAWMLSVVHLLSFFILYIGFDSLLVFQKSEILLVLASISLSVLSIGFWGFIESRTRWLAGVRSGRHFLSLESPTEKAKIFSKLFFCWNIRLLMFGYNSKLSLIDIPEIPPEERLENCYKTFSNYLNLYGRDSLLKAFFFSLGNYYYPLILHILYLVCHMLLPSFFLPRILQVMNCLVYETELCSRWEYQINTGYFYIFFLFLVLIVSAISYQHGWYWALRCGLRARNSYIMAVYDKILTSRNLLNTGEVINFLSSDSTRLIECVRFGWWLLLAPCALIVIMGILIYKIGFITILGMLFLFLQVPVQIFIGNLIHKARSNVIDLTDKRVKVMNDILTSIKTIKLYCWEESFSKMVLQIREEEAKSLSKLGTIKFINYAISHLSPVAATFICLSIYSIKHDISPVLAYTVAALFNASSAPLSCLPIAISNIFQALIGLQRLLELLKKGDLHDTRLLNLKRTPSVFVKDGTFAFDTDPEDILYYPDMNSIEDLLRGKFVLRNIDLQIAKPGCLIGIVGRVGSGKSCLLNAIAGQIAALKGKVEVNGSLAFMTQSALLLNTTVRDNITFGLPFDQNRYKSVIEATQLLSDLAILRNGDQTEIGERGAMLSGGQKARVSLARAVYSNRDIYLLDDPFSAVDAKVGARIFEKCICGVLKEKIILLTTNQSQYLPRCDHIVILENGLIRAQGSFSQLHQFEEYSTLLNMRKLDENEKSNVGIDTILGEPSSFKVTQEHGNEISDIQFGSSNCENEKAIGKKLAFKDIFTNSTNKKPVAEKVGNYEIPSNEPGSIPREKDMIPVEHVTMFDSEELKPVDLATFIYYCFAAGTLSPIVIILLFLFTQANRVTIDLFIGLIGRLYKGPGGAINHIEINISLRSLIIIYFFFVVLYMIMLASRAFLFSRSTINSATHIHKIVFHKVLRAPMSFFDKNPLGRILNRFSRDLDIVDGRLPDFFIDAIVFSVHCLSTIIIICAVVWQFIFIIILMSLVFWMVINYYQRSARELKTLDASTLSPIFSHLSISISGITTIRAYNAQERFRQENKEKINVNSRVFFTFEAVTNWLGLSLDMVSACITAITGTFILMFGSRMGPSIAGFALSYAFMLAAAFQYTVRMSTETENLLISVARLKDYAETLKQEGILPHYDEVPENWPSNGKIEFRNIEVRYHPHLPAVLKDVSFVIRPREKVGIVGRTGAGKSTLIQVLFRLIELTAGSILIDGVFINNLRLSDLRKKLACIPQDPVLFLGTIRSNLDPFNEHTDSELWDSLERVQMKEVIDNIPGKIDSPIMEGGINFSLGQRQLICIARAILRNSKILVLDEATASIDIESDNIIQRTIRSSFSDVTVLAIAHRLTTIIDYERIIVVENGGIVEFDTPKNLLDNKNGVFYSMYHQTK